MSAMSFGGPLVCIPLFVCQINVKWAKDALFSEREKLVPTMRLGKLLFVWRKWRAQ